MAVESWVAFCRRSRGLAGLPACRAGAAVALVALLLVMGACNASTLPMSADVTRNDVEPAAGAGAAAAPSATTPASAAEEAQTGDTPPTGSTGAGGDDEDDGQPQFTAADFEGAEFRDTKTMQARVYVKIRPAVKDCYVAARKQKPHLKGRLTITTKIDPEGKVVSAELDEGSSGLKEPSVVECAIAKMKTLQFLPHEKGMESTMHYPFCFGVDCTKKQTSE